ncbi:MAG: hypothetical protein AB8F74_01000, partial [Saprospiraceae bacterium]
KDITLGVENAKQVFEKYATPYFQKYDSLEKLSDLLNREAPPKDLKGNFQFHGNKADAPVIGIIAAFILQEKDIDKLIKYHLDNPTSTSLQHDLKLVKNYFKN